MSAAVQQPLCERCGTDDDDLVFTCEGEHLDHYRLRKRYYEALDRAGLRRLRFHDLRHAFGSAAITKLDPYAVQSYMGHQHYSTTQRISTTSRGGRMRPGWPMRSGTNRAPKRAQVRTKRHKPACLRTHETHPAQPHG